MMSQLDKKIREQIKRITSDIIPTTNMTIAKMLLCISALCVGMLFLFQFGVLKSKGSFVYATFILMPALFVISSIWCLMKKGKSKAFQYIFLFLLLFLWFALELMSGYKTKMLLPILIIISLLYYDKRVTMFTYIISSVSLLISNWCNAYLYAETDFLDLNIVSFNGSFPTVLEGFIYNNIIDLKPSSITLFINGLRLTVFPNFIFLTVITFIAMYFMKVNLNNIVKTEELTEKEANQRVELSEVKTKVMLSQIKPHFIYNTLTTISYFCSEDPQKADELTNRFSEYLKNNLSSLSETEAVAFSKELEVIKNYLEIEKMRFEERINVEYDIRFEDFAVPVLTIQPVVENAVKHGICKKEDGGTVKISSLEEENYYCIIVQDDGVGFDKDAVNFDGKEHVGVKNIISRIENFGGEVEIESKVGVGTTVTIRLPKEEKVC